MTHSLKPAGEATLTFVIDGGGSVLTTGNKGDLEVPFNCVIEHITVLADQSGAATIDLYRSTYGGYPPVVGGSLSAGANVVLASVASYQDSALSGWTKTLTQGDIIRFHVVSATTITRLTVSLRVRK